MAGTFSDQAELAQLFQQSLSPITTYSQGALALALQDRQQRLQAAQQERSINLYSQSRIAEEKARYEMETAAVQKQKREDALAQARAAGISAAQLPDDASYTDILTAVTKSHGRELVASAQSAGAALSEYARFRGETVDQVTKRAISMAIGGVTPKELKEAGITQQQLNAWLADPSKLDDMLARAARDKNEKASTLLNRLNAETSQNIQTGMMDAEKYNPRLTGLAERFKLAHADFMDLRKKGGVDEASSIESSKALVMDYFQAKAPAAKREPNFSLTPRTGAVPGAVPVNPAPAVLAPAETVTPGGFITQGITDAARAVVNKGPGFINSLIYPSTNAPPAIAAPMFPGITGPFDATLTSPVTPGAVDPSVLSTLRLRKFLEDSSAVNNSLFPTAYPTPNFLSPTTP